MAMEMKIFVISYVCFLPCRYYSPLGRDKTYNLKRPSLSINEYIQDNRNKTYVSYLDLSNEKVVETSSTMPSSTQGHTQTFMHLSSVSQAQTQHTSKKKTQNCSYPRASLILTVIQISKILSGLVRMVHIWDPGHLYMFQFLYIIDCITYSY